MLSRVVLFSRCNLCNPGPDPMRLINHAGGIELPTYGSKAIGVRYGYAVFHGQSFAAAPAPPCFSSFSSPRSFSPSFPANLLNPSPSPSSSSRSFSHPLASLILQAPIRSPPGLSSTRLPMLVTTPSSSTARSTGQWATSSPSPPHPSLPPTWIRYEKLL